MDRMSAVIAIGAVLCVTAVMPAPALRGNDVEAAKSFAQPSAGPSPSAPIVVAQGRCFNGRCF
jgi:hypothetical protein